MDLVYYRAELVSDSFQTAVSGPLEEARSAGVSHPVTQDALFKQESKKIKIFHNNPGEQSEDQYGGDHQYPIPQREPLIRIIRNRPGRQFAVPVSP